MADTQNTSEVTSEEKKAPEPEVVTKARYWWAVFYPENMIDGWENRIGDIVQVPFAYCIHDADLDAKEEERKKHGHLILVFPNTTTYRHALSVFKLLGANAVNTCKAIINIRHAYDYLIHDTATCKKQGKHLYAPEDRICGNNFDIGSYEQISLEDKRQMLKELIGWCLSESIENMADFWLLFNRDFGDKAVYFEVATAYNNILKNTVSGIYHKHGQKREKAD